MENIVQEFLESATSSDFIDLRKMISDLNDDVLNELVPVIDNIINLGMEQ